MMLDEVDVEKIYDFMAEEDIYDVEYLIKSYKRMKKTLRSLKDNIEILDDTGDLD